MGNSPVTAVISSGALRGYRELVRELGGNPTPLLRRLRIQPSSLDDEDAMIPAGAHIHLMELSAKTLECPDFGLRLGSRQDISILGPLALAMRHSRTAGAAIQCASRRLFVQTQAVALTVLPKSPQAPQLTELRVELVHGVHAVTRQFTDHSLAALDQIARFLSPQAYRLRRVCLNHTPVAPAATYRRLFGAPVRFAQPHACLLIEPRFLDSPMRAVDELLGRMALEYLDSHFTSPSQTVAPRVRMMLSGAMGSTSVTRAHAAGLLRLHPRTLQRRLAIENTDFETLRDEVRQQLTLRYLGSTTLPVGHVAELVGLAHGSALTRCCLRWFGGTPSSIRHREQGIARDGAPSKTGRGGSRRRR